VSEQKRGGKEGEEFAEVKMFREKIRRGDWLIHNYYNFNINHNKSRNRPMSTGKSRGEGLNCPLLAIPAFAVELFRWRCQGWRHI
jgi:hypothetical protein